MPSLSRKGHDVLESIAQVFRDFGADVELEAQLAGNLLDIVVVQPQENHPGIRTAIEVKNLTSPLDASAVTAFAGITALLKERKLIDNAMIISVSGFNEDARRKAEYTNVELLTLEELEQKFDKRQGKLPRTPRTGTKTANETVASTISGAASIKQTKAFVVMPFSQDLDDVYVLGVREVGEKLHLLVERADDIQHNESIPDTIIKKIRASDVVIADTSSANLNVFYEVGMAHALKKKTILICRDVQTLPFDIRHINHIVYGSIVDLRGKLEARLIETLKLNNQKER